MKLKGHNCPFIYTIQGRIKEGNPQRPLYNRCSKIKMRCIYTHTSKRKEFIKPELIKRCPIRRNYCFN